MPNFRYNTSESSHREYHSVYDEEYCTEHCYTNCTYIINRYHKSEISKLHSENRIFLENNETIIKIRLTVWLGWIPCLIRSKWRVWWIILYQKKISDFCPQVFPLSWFFRKKFAHFNFSVQKSLFNVVKWRPPSRSTLDSQLHIQNKTFYPNKIYFFVNFSSQTQNFLKSRNQPECHEASHPLPITRQIHHISIKAASSTFLPQLILPQKI